MSDDRSIQVSEIIARIPEEGLQVRDELLPVVYAELRSLARARMAQVPAGNSLQPTALVHEAYLQLLGGSGEALNWNNRGHFFAAASRAMRQILVDQVRRKSREKHGGDRKRVEAEDEALQLGMPSDEFLALEEALELLEAQDKRKATIVMMRFFGGLEIKEIALALEVSEPTIKREWKLARSILHALMQREA